jgi:hypothetical protein
MHRKKFTRTYYEPQIIKLEKNLNIDDAFELAKKKAIRDFNLNDFQYNPRNGIVILK